MSCSPLGQILEFPTHPTHPSKPGHILAALGQVQQTCVILVRFSPNQTTAGISISRTLAAPPLKPHTGPRTTRPNRERSRPFLEQLPARARPKSVDWVASFRFVFFESDARSIRFATTINSFGKNKKKANNFSQLFPPDFVELTSFSTMTHETQHKSHKHP